MLHHQLTKMSGRSDIKRWGAERVFHSRSDLVWGERVESRIRVKSLILLIDVPLKLMRFWCPDVYEVIVYDSVLKHFRCFSISSPCLFIFISAPFFHAHDFTHFSYFLTVVAENERGRKEEMSASFLLKTIFFLFFFFPLFSCNGNLYSLLYMSHTVTLFTLRFLSYPFK